MAHAQPNILLITTDQQRHDTVGAQAPGFLRTPHLDHLEREGITFGSAYSDCPVCVPARMSIMTGQNATTHGMARNGSSSVVLAGTPTLPALVREQGYQTAAIGKMHFTPQRARHGFEEMIIPEDYYREFRDSGSPLQPMRHGLGQNELYPGLSTVPEAMTLTSWTVDQSADYILERRDPSKPFFLWCSFSKPHPPLDPPEPYYSMYRDEPIPEPVMGDWSFPDRLPPVMRRFWQRHSYDLLSPSVIRAARQAYYGLITHIDYAIGRLFAALQDVGIFNDTLILFTSDHGEFLGDHGGGNKVFCHEPSAHVPFILRLPQDWADRRPGTTVDVPVTLADVLPTLVTAAGGRLPEACDGLDLVAVARSPADCDRDYLVLLSEGINGTPSIPDYLAITDGRWKYCWYPEGSMEHFFDLASDPNELRDLSEQGDAEPRKDRLRNALIEELRRRGGHLLDNGDLPRLPRITDTESDRRNRSWPGYHSAGYPVDVRH